MHKTVLGKDSTSDITLKKIVVTDQPSKTASSKQKTLTEKYNSNMKFQHVRKTMRVNRNISTPSHDSLDKFFIGFCFPINKCLSNTCITENYSKAVKVSLLLDFAELKYS